MAYTNVWTIVSPTGSTPAKQIDEEFRKFRLDVQERMNSIVTDWTADPVVPSSSFGGPATGKGIYIQSSSFVQGGSDPTGVTYSFGKLTTTQNRNYDFYAAITLPAGAKVRGYTAQVIPGAGPITVRFGNTVLGPSEPVFTTVDSNTATGTNIVLVSNAAAMNHSLNSAMQYMIWISTQSSALSPSSIYGVQVVYDIDNIRQTI
jgi:hypothetical protein